MTAVTLAPHPELKVTQSRVMRSEWIKFWSLRSTTVTLAAAVTLFVGVGLLAASLSTDPGAPGGGPGGGPVDTSLAGVNLGQLVLGTLGVLFMASEYTTGMIRSSLAAVPTRLPMLWAKVLVFTGVTFPLSLASAFVAFLGGQAIIGDGGASLSDPGVIRAVIGSAVYLTGAGLLGLGLGAVLRSTAAAISTFFGVMFLLQGVSVLLLPDSWQNTVGPYLPSEAGSAIGAVTQQADQLTPWGGLAVYLGYLAVIGAAAAWRLKHHDA
jgi:hypothetical protein